MPRASATLRSCLSLVHRRVGELIKMEAIRCASVRPTPRLYSRRASIMGRNSLNWATRTGGNKSSRASVLVRACKDPRASSAMTKGWITICPWLRSLRISLSPERRWSIQIDVSARINSIAPWFSRPATRNTLQSGHCACQRRQSAGAFALDERLESFTNQRSFLGDSGELLGNADEIVIECNGCPHRNSWHLL